MSRIQQLLEQYKLQLQCDFSLYDFQKDCLTTTLDKKNQYNHKKEMVSIEVEEDTFYLIAENKIDKQSLILVAIACKEVLQSYDERVEETIRLAFLGELSDEELKELDKKLDWSKGKGFILLKVSKSGEEFEEILKEVIEGRVYKLESYFVLIVDKNEEEEIEQSAERLIQIIHSELMLSAVSYVEEITSIAQANASFEKAKKMVTLRDDFFPALSVMARKSLGVEQVVSELSQERMMQIIEESGIDFSQLDSQDDMGTICVFFANDLNIAKTAQDLYLHRNTLIYRLDKYQKWSGLDIRKFDEALKLKLYLMIYRLVK